MLSDLFILTTSVLSSGLIASVISFSFSEAKERWLLRRAKLEEIYIGTTEWTVALSSQYLLYLRVCKGLIDYNQMLDLTIKNGNDKKGIGAQFIRLKMNIFMYEPRLITSYENLDSSREKLAHIGNLIAQKWKETGQASELFTPLNKELDSFAKATSALQSEIIRRGAEVGSERGQAAQALHRIRSIFLSMKSFVAEWFSRKPRGD